jgi:WD40 repeat protein
VVLSARFSHDDAVVVSCGMDCTVRVWDWHSTACVAVFAGHVDCVQHVDVSLSGRFVVSCGGFSDRNVVLWDLTGAVSGRRYGHGSTAASHLSAASSASSSAFSSFGEASGVSLADGGSVVGSARMHKSGSERFGDRRTVDSSASSLPGVASFAASVTCSSAFIRPFGSTAIAASATASRRVGDGVNPALAHADWVNCCRFNADETLVVSAANDATVKVW